MSATNAMLTFILLAMCIGCATGKSRGPAAVSAVDSKKYSRNLRPVSSRSKNSFSRSQCSKDKKKWSKLNWEKLVEIGNSCVVFKKWSRVNMLGVYMSQANPTSPWGPYYLSLFEEQKGNIDKSSWLIELALK